MREIEKTFCFCTTQRFVQGHETKPHVNQVTLLLAIPVYQTSAYKTSVYIRVSKKKQAHPSILLTIYAI